MGACILDRLDIKIKSKLSKPLILKELIVAMSDKQARKSFGPTRIILEFYKKN